MGTAREDYVKFIRWIHLDDQQAPEGARRFANMVLAHFDSVATTSRHRSQRSNQLATLAREYLSATDPGLPDLPDETPQGEWPWTRLHRFSLGPFRGFRNEQTFDLSKRLILCYGPNGSGKSSLCEGLEYSLLGSVDEADNKRLQEAAYLSNLHAGRFAVPSLTARGSNDAEIPVQANGDIFRFCFVEKNRIDSFSRIAARPPSRRTELIATLFGMDKFNEFASHFNDSMEAALALGNQEQTTLAARRQALIADQETSDSELAQLEQHAETCARYAANFGEGVTYSDLKSLIGSTDAPGRLQDLETQINVGPPPVTGLTRHRLNELYAKADASVAALRRSAEGLEHRRSQISFRDLYSVVTTLQSLDSEHCPACKTPISQTLEDPFEKAKAGLQELAELAILEANHDRLSRERQDASRCLLGELRKVNEYLLSQGDSENLVARYIQNLPDEHDSNDWWTGVKPPDVDQSGAKPSLELIMTVVDRAAREDQEAKAALDTRQDYIQERDQLNNARVWIAEQDAIRAGIVGSAATARARIIEWEAANANLIQRSTQEALGNLRDRPIQQAYASFISLLDSFRDHLPGMLMADLNHEVIQLYNEFNHSDREEDKLARLRLPLTGDERIKISFRGNPNRHVDALTALSEGHIRCLGLAILLAKATSIRAPLIVFDDAINAIDHDHRGGIRSTIFESDRFRETQIIITCHSPEFIKDVENNLPIELRRDCQRYVLGHHIGDYQPRVNPDVGSTNYLVRANEAMNRFDPRDALSQARKSLEMLLNKSWKWLESHRVGDISVQIGGPGKEPQLRALCDALRIKLNGTATFAHASKDPLVNALNTILGIPEQNLVWTLLNKGTHEERDRDDFDREHVVTVISTLETIDQLELRPGR